MLRDLLAGICSEKQTVFQEYSSKKAVGFEEQIMSKDKYPSILFAPNRGYFVYYSSFFSTNSVLKIGGYHSDIPQF